MTMHKALHPRDDVDRLYVSRKQGRRGFASIEHNVDTSIQRLEDYIKKRGGRLITATRNNTDNTSNKRTKITRKQKWEEKQLYGHFHRQTSKISREKSWTWLKKGNLWVTESLLIAAQNNAIMNNYAKAIIDKTQQNSSCRLFGDRDETVNHIINDYSELAQKECKARHDWVGKVIHWEMCKKFKFDYTNQWYMHNPESVLETEMHKILWNFEIPRIT